MRTTWLMAASARPSLSPAAVFVAYAMVTGEGASLYTDPRKITPEVADHLKEGGVEVGGCGVTGVVGRGCVAAGEVRGHVCGR
jgi:hypothetical protein